MKQRIKSVLSSILFVIICFLLCGLSLHYFFTDLRKSSVRNDKEIARIYLKKKIAQRKFSDSVVWERLQVNSPLYNEDIIRTDVEASAVMKFSKGAVVDLDEKTMIQVFEGKDGELKFSVSGGNFTVDTTESSSSMKIDLGNGSIINLEKGSRLSAVNEDGINSIVIQQGAGSIITENGEEEFILAGDSLKIEEDGSRKKIPVTVSNLDSVQKVLLYLDKNVPVKFKAESEYISRPIAFEVSEKPDFSEIKNKYSLLPSENINLTVSKGIYYYRVYPEGEVENAYEGKLIVEEIKKPRLISPTVDFNYESINTMPEVTFIWENSIYSDFSRIEIYDSNDMNNPVVSQDVNDSSVKITCLDEGKYFWKIVPHYSINDIGFLDPLEMSSFGIVRQKLNLIPELNVPVMGANIVLGEEDKDIVFACKSDIKISDYRFEVSKDIDFENDIVYATTDKTLKRAVSFKISSLPKGKYYWRVIRIDEDRKEYYSTVRDFSVSEYVPKVTQLVYPPENYSVETASLSSTQFIWNLADSIDLFKTQSVIEIAKDINFTKDVNRVKTSGISYTGIKLAEGKYYWRVKAVNTDDNSEVAKTEPRLLTVLKELSLPVITSPVNNTSLSIYENESVKISWQAVSGAEYYKVRILDDKKGTVISEYESVKTNSINVSLPADVSLNCSVQALSDEKAETPARSSKISNVKFTVNKASKIQLVYPKNNAKIAGLAALKNPVIFNWTEDSTEKTKEFVLTKVYSNGTSEIVRTVKNPAGSVSLKRLAPGNYFWTVNAVSKSGVSLNPDVKFSFTILPVEPLSKVEIISPVNNFVIDVDYLKKNRIVSFKWISDQYATDYTFELYQKNSNGTLRKIVSEKLTSSNYVLSDLKQLDVGKFEWHVTAYIHAADGYEEQKSEMTRSDFEVNFDLPDKVKTIDPGRMYAE